MSCRIYLVDFGPCYGPKFRRWELSVHADSFASYITLFYLNDLDFWILGDRNPLYLMRFFQKRYSFSSPRCLTTMRTILPFRTCGWPWPTSNIAINTFVILQYSKSTIPFQLSIGVLGYKDTKIDMGCIES